jgi:hypothetical protein
MPPKRRPDAPPATEELPNKKTKTEQNADLVAHHSINTLQKLAPISATKAFKAGRDTGPLSQISLRTVFAANADTVKYAFNICTCLPALLIEISKLSRLENFTIAPTAHGLVNIATCDYNKLQAVGKYKNIIHRGSKKNALCFITGVVSHSALVTDANSRQICILPSDLTWNHVTAVLGQLFNQWKLAFNTFRMGVSFSTLKKKEYNDSNTKKISSLGISSTSTSMTPATQNNPLPYNCDSMSSG